MGLIDIIKRIPADADLRLMDPGPVPVAVYGGQAHTYPGSGADVIVPLGTVRRSLKIDRREFYAWLFLRGTANFEVNGVPIITGSYAGARGTAFDVDGPRALTPSERLAVDSGTASEIAPGELVDALLRGDRGATA